MTKKEYKAYYRRILDAVVGRTYYDPMLSMVHVMTVDEKKELVIPMLSKDCESMTWFEKEQCVTVQKCLNERRDIDYAEALLLLGDSYKENINSYMDYGRMIAPGLYPIRWYELELLAWSGSLDSDIVCICRDVELTSTYNYVHVCRDGYVKRTSMNGDRLFDPDDDYICFLIDLEYASFIRRKMKKEEALSQTPKDFSESPSNSKICIDLSQISDIYEVHHTIGSANVIGDTEIEILIENVSESNDVSIEDRFSISCDTKSLTRRIFYDVSEELGLKNFGQPSESSIRTMLESKGYNLRKFKIIRRESVQCKNNTFGIACKDKGLNSFDVLVYLMDQPIMVMSPQLKEYPDFRVCCVNEETQDRILKSIEEEFVEQRFGPLSFNSIRSKLIYDDFPSSTWYCKLNTKKGIDYLREKILKK